LTKLVEAYIGLISDSGSIPLSSTRWK